MLKIFRKSNPFNIALLFLIALFVHFKVLFWAFQYKDLLHDSFIQPFSFLIIKYIPQLRSEVYVSVWVGFLILFGNLLYFNHILCTHRIFKHYNFVPLLIAIILSGLFPSWIFFSAQMLAFTIILWVVDVLMDVYTHDASSSKIFHLSFFIAVASLFYLPSVYLLLFVALTLLFFSSFTWRDFFILCFGFLLPYFFLFSICYLTDQLSFLENKFQGLLPIAFIFREPHTIIDTINIFMVLLLLSYAMFYFYTKYFKSLIHVRKFYNMYAFMLGITLLLGLLQTYLQKSSFLFTLLPLTMMISYFVYNESKRVWSEVLVAALIFWIFANNIS